MTILRVETILAQPIKTTPWNAVLVITPEQAKLVLESQPVQRRVWSGHVDDLVLALNEGRWKLTHEGLAFDAAGVLFDGQHRLWACFMSGRPMTVRCFFIESRSNFDAIGTLVRRRNDADHLAVAGVTSESSLGNTVAGAARFLWAYDNGTNPLQAALRKGWNPGVMRAAIARHPGIVSMTEYLRARRKMPLPLTPFVALGVLMEEADPQKSAIFLHQVTSGESIVAGDPAHTLRESALAHLATPRGYRVDMAYRIVRAWNAFYEGRPLRRLYGSNSPTAGNAGLIGRKGGLDIFPRIAGLNVAPVVAVTKRIKTKAAPAPVQTSSLLAH